uniref:Uncharacterized protein n=1 Tax=Oryza rufipogon TaxID=4529 RepID=A0A0E0RJ75_ORYRU
MWDPHIFFLSFFFSSLLFSFLSHLLVLLFATEEGGAAASEDERPEQAGERVATGGVEWGDSGSGRARIQSSVASASRSWRVSAGRGVGRLSVSPGGETPKTVAAAIDAMSSSTPLISF